MKLIGLALVALSISASSAFAAMDAYDLKINLALNGKKVTSTQISVKAGEMATLIQKTNSEEIFIEVTASEGTVQGRKGIMTAFTVGTIDKNGARTVVSSPQILAKENEPAQIAVSGKDGSEQLSLSVLANRKSLQVKRILERQSKTLLEKDSGASV